MLLLIAAIAAFSAPVPVNPHAWFQGSMLFPHPKTGIATVIAADILVNRYGYVESCDAHLVRGNPAWEPFTCGRIQAAGEFRSAKLNGEAVYGLYRLRVTWDVWPAPSDAPIWDFEVPISKVPASLKLPTLAKIQFVVDASGKLEGCSAEGNWKFPELAALACVAAPAKLVIRPLKSRSENAVPTVQDATVRFIPETASK